MDVKGRSTVIFNLIKYRKQFLFVILPLILMPLPILNGDQKSKCGYVLLLMSLYWMFQVVPVAVTGFIPFLLLPMFEIMNPAEIMRIFFTPFVVVFVAGFMISTSLELSGLHKRIALTTLILMGSRQQLTLLGLMLPTWFMSMWISNTPVCVMMITIAEEIVAQLEKQEISKHQHSHLPDKAHLPDEVTENGTAAVLLELEDTINISNSNLEDKQHADIYDPVELPHNSSAHEEGIKAWFQNLRVCYVLAIGYSSTIGGTASISGTSMNLLIKDIADEIWQEHGHITSPINFTSWMILNLPISVMNMLAIWAWFCLHFFTSGPFSRNKEAQKFKNKDDTTVMDYLKKELGALGKVKYSEYAVMILLLVQVSLWFFLDLDFMDGWNTYFAPGFVTMAVPSALIILISSIIPSELPCYNNGDTVPTVGDWSAMERSFPWGVLFMIGGGKVMAHALKISGLSAWITESLSVMNAMPPVAAALALSLLVTLFTEIIANMVAVYIFVPIAGNLAITFGKNPLYLLLPVALSTQYSFVLPMAGAVNAYMLTTGKAQVIDSIRAGTLINIIAVFVTLLATHTWGMAYFDLNTVPWEIHNITGNATEIPG